MGHVIEVDFTSRTNTASRTSADPSMSSDASIVPLHVDASETIATAEVPEVVSPSIPDGGGRTGNSTKPRHAGEGSNLVDACARMRADTAALQEAVENLRRATADMHRLPALARELCEAAV
ncbi:hypothetical protein CKO28_26490 [Rhodovibrio sodomensis]|uniref:Uncharacterized protein n=1 Tax=Rhodovibrio sodomensis TaxID=1088 RepID=A0ABS1DLY0_9PROT|nr:hypothetical protein [Rhodovibrio sodomensis]MBK1671551.1 hypothetical protein [Rhodovibrio sodomensis]